MHASVVRQILRAQCRQYVAAVGLHFVPWLRLEYNDFGENLGEKVKGRREWNAH